MSISEADLDQIRAQQHNTSATLALPRVLAQALDWALALLLALLPFELMAGLELGGLLLTNVELALLFTLGLWLLLLAVERRLPRVPRRFWLPLALAVALMLLSALLAAPQQRGVALKFSLRQAQGALLALCVAERVGLAGWPLARRLLAALLGGALLSALLGLAELSEAPPLLTMLGIFKEKPTLMGGLLRLSATFGYANIAAMYFEALLPLALLWKGIENAELRIEKANHSTIRTRLFSILNSQFSILAPLLLYAATLFTYSRAAFISALAVALLTPAAVYALQVRTSRAAARPLPSAACLLPTGILLLFTAALLALSPTMRLRLGANDPASWYAATYQVAPLAPLVPDEVRQVPVTVTNTGQAPWRPDGLRPFSLSYHWLDADTRSVVRFNGHRTPFPGSVAPGQQVTLSARVQAPQQQGRYLLAWDLVQEHAGWLSQSGTPVAEVLVQVLGNPPAGAAATPQTAPPPPAEPAHMPRTLRVYPPTPARGDLWRAALTLWRSSPLLGIGPDVFRHVYGPAIGVQDFDNRVHTNNLYLELLVGGGALGLLASAILLAAVVWPALGALVVGVRGSGYGVRGSGFGVRGVSSHSPMSRVPHTPNPIPRTLSPEPYPLNPIPYALIACLAALAAFLIHGLLDMFLEFTATYLLLWLLLGLTVALTDVGSQ